jgi:hypothetical protein
MRNTTEPFDLSPFATDYDIIGEADASSDARTFIATRKGDGAKRRDDQTGALITIVTTPEGDEGNALTHLAADVQLLARTPHRRLAPVIEGRWLGDDAFAVVTQRTSDPSLAQRLATSETFTNPRIAAILREVNGLLEWARSQQVVHRSIPASRLFLEPKTDRVRVSFAIAPIRRLHHADAQDDARTIARLAVAMLTGEVDPQTYTSQTLAELRPDLPSRLCEATAVLLDEKRTDTAPDVAAYLALIGMADPVAAGESEAERIRAEVFEEQRVEREKLAAERAIFVQTLADEREKFEQERIVLQKALTSERDELQRAVNTERAELEAKRIELERVVAAQRTELERVAAQDRKMIAELREAIRKAGEHVVEQKRQTALDDMTDLDDALDQHELATPAFVAPTLAPIAPLAFSNDSPLMRRDELVPLRDDAMSSGTASGREAKRSGTSRRKTWILSAAAAAAVVLIGISVSLISSRVSAPGPVAAQPVAHPATKVALAPGTIASPPIVASTPGAQLRPQVADSASVRLAARWLDSLREAHPVELTSPVRIVREPTLEQAAGERAPDERAPATERASKPERAVPAAINDPFFIPGSTPPPRVTPSRDSTRPVSPPPR